MSVYKLAATGVGGTENGIAQLDVQFDGVITAIYGDVVASFAATANRIVTEASFLSTNTVGSNDTRGSLFQLTHEAFIQTSGYTTVGKQASVSGLAILLNAGERLWMHIVATASIPSDATIFIYVEDGQGVPTSQRRR